MGKVIYCRDTLGIIVEHTFKEGVILIVVISPCGLIKNFSSWSALGRSISTPLYSMTRRPCPPIRTIAEYSNGILKDKVWILNIMLLSILRRNLDYPPTEGLVECE